MQVADFGFAVVSTFMAMDLIVELRSSEMSWYGPAALILNVKSSGSESEETHFAPEFTPRISDNPIETLFGISAPTNNRDDMINTTSREIENA